jgi:hypothetical protein
MSQSIYLEDRRPRRSTPRQERLLLIMLVCLVLAIRAPYIQLAAYITYRVSPIRPMRHTYVPTSLIRMLSNPSQLTCMHP